MASPVLLVSVIYLFALKTCSSVAVSIGPNAKYFELASQFMNDAHLYYSAVDKESIFTHLSDDFIWHWESDKTISKEKFIALNEELYGMNNRSATQFFADVIGNKYVGGISYAWFERGENPCKSWMFTWEVFIFQDNDHDADADADTDTVTHKPLIKERYSFPVNKKLYTKNNFMLSSPECKWKSPDDWDYSRDEAMADKLEEKMYDYFMYSELFYRKRGADANPESANEADDEEKKRLFYDQVSDGLVWYDGSEKYDGGKSEWRDINDVWFARYDEMDMLYEMDVYGEFFTGGYVHTHVRIGECKEIFMTMIMAYFDWDVEHITEILRLPLDEGREAEFIKCVQEQDERESDREQEEEKKEL